MTEIMSSLSAYLYADTAIAAATSKRPQVGRFTRDVGNKAAISIRRVGGDPEYNLIGEEDCVHTVISVEVRSVTWQDANDLMELIRQRISGFRGTMSEVLVHGCTRVTDVLDTRMEPSDSSDNYTTLLVTDYRIAWSQASTPTYV